MHFIAAVIRLLPRSATTLGVADSIFAHAAILHAISDQDPNLGQSLHEMQRHKHMTLAIVKSSPRSAKLRVTFMDPGGKAYVEALINTLSFRSVLRLGKVECDVGSIDLNDGEWAGIGTWQDLRQETQARHICLSFVTPTAITKRDDADRRFTSLLPIPMDVFGGLARRWQALPGPPLPDGLPEYLQSGGLVIADYHLHTEAFKTCDRTQIGFLGSAVYECLKNDTEYNAAIRALARLSFFTGVGYQTARGMGATKVDFLD